MVRGNGKRRKSMNRKSKLFFSLVSLCFSIAVLCFGVYSALSVSYSISGSVSYELQDVFVDIETSLFMSTEGLEEAKENVHTNISNLEQSLKNNQTPNNMVKSSYLDTHSTYNNGQVDSRYEITFTNQGNELSITYGNFVQGESAYSYFVVIKITNYAENSIGVTIIPNIQNLNTLTQNNFLSKNVAGAEEGAVTEYFILSMTLDDATLSVNGNFDLDVNITKDTVATTNLVLNDDQGNALKTLEGINYSTKSLELTEPTYFVPDENAIIFAYNMEFTNIPQNITALNFSCKINDEKYKQSTYPVFGTIEGNYADILSLISVCQPIINGDGGELLGLSVDMTTIGKSLVGENITPYHERNYGMYIGQHEQNLKFCLVVYCPILGEGFDLQTAPSLTLSMSFTDKLDKEIYFLREDGTYAWGLNLLLGYNSQFAQTFGNISEITVPAEYMGKQVSSVYYMMSGFGLGANLNVAKLVFEGNDTQFELWAFEGIETLKEVILPTNLKEIPDDCFSGCGLTSIEIPESVTIIGVEALLNCPFTSIVIPSGVQIIRNMAFSSYGDLPLNTVYLDSEYVASDEDMLVSSQLLYSFKSGTSKLYILSTIPEQSICSYITDNFNKGGSVSYDGKLYVEYTKI